MATPFMTMYVSREVECPVHDVSVAIDQLPDRTNCDGMSLTIGRAKPCRQPTSACDPWRARPTSLRGRRLQPSFQASLEVVPWSSTRSQIGLRPEGWACRAFPDAFCDAAHWALARLHGVLLDTIAAAAPSAPLGEISCAVHDVEFDDGNRVALVKVAGDLYYDTSDDLREEVIEPLDAGARRVLVDLAGVRSVDSAGLATLVLVTHECTDASLTLTGVPDSVKDSIDELGYAELLKVA